MKDVVHTMKQDKIDRISELTRISRQRPLTPAEQEERTQLRREYLDAVRASLSTQLDHTILVDEQGNQTPVRRKNTKNS